VVTFLIVAGIGAAALVMVLASALVIAAAMMASRVEESLPLLLEEAAEDVMERDELADADLNGGSDE
jgi:hypothetical protein